MRSFSGAKAREAGDKHGRGIEDAPEHRRAAKQQGQRIHYQRPAPKGQQKPLEGQSVLRHRVDDRLVLQLLVRLGCFPRNRPARLEHHTFVARVPRVAHRILARISCNTGEKPASREFAPSLPIGNRSPRHRRHCHVEPGRTLHAPCSRRNSISHQANRNSGSRCLGICGDVDSLGRTLRPSRRPLFHPEDKPCICGAAPIHARRVVSAAPDFQLPVHSSHSLVHAV